MAPSSPLPTWPSAGWRLQIRSPKIDQVTFLFIPDPRTMVANVLAGSVDATDALGWEGSLLLRQEWGKSGGGTIEVRPSNWRHAVPQMRPELAKPVDLLNRSV